MTGSQHDFPVQDGNGVTGLLTRTDLIAGLSKRGPECHVADVMRRDYRTIDASDSVEGVFMRIAESQEYAIPVTEGVRLVGLLTSDNLFSQCLQDGLWPSTALNGAVGAAWSGSRGGSDDDW